MGDGLRVVDTDVDSPDLAQAIDQLAVEMLGDGPRRGRNDSPRWARVYLNGGYYHYMLQYERPDGDRVRHGLHRV